MTSSEERKGQNQARFAGANEQLERGARRLVGADGSDLVPFICECPRPGCTEVALLTLPEYEEVRAHEAQSISVLGHEDESIEDVVKRTDRYIVTEKRGRAAEAFEAEREPA